MKKKLVLSMVIIAIIVLIISCQKDNKSTQINLSKRDIISNSYANKTGGLKVTGFEGSYLLSSVVGHSSTDCGNACITLNGVRTHIDCQKFGNKCSFNANISINKVILDDSDPYYYAIGINNNEPTDDSVFFMPNRSFYVETIDTVYRKVWLNIPNQILRRDIISNQFIYDSITFTNEQLFENR